jgi:hypothetical protein
MDSVMTVLFAACLFVHGVIHEPGGEYNYIESSSTTSTTT